MELKKHAIIIGVATILSIAFFRKTWVAPEEQEKGYLTIGTTLDLSKSRKFEGKKMEEGLNLYIRKINREGGIKGRKIKLVVLDDGYEPNRARKNVELLLNKYKTNIILSPLGSPTTAAYLDLIKEKKILVVFPFTGASILRNPSYSNVIHLTPGYDQIELTLFKYALETLGSKRFGILDEADDITPIDRTILKDAGVKKENYIFLRHEPNTTNFSKQIEHYQAFKPDTIALLSTPSAATAFLRQLGMEKLFGKKLLGIQLGSIKFDEFIKEHGLENQFFDIQTVPDPESNLPILIEYRKEMNGEKPDAFSALGYIAAALFFDLLKRSEGPITNGTIIEKIIKTAENTKNYNFGGLELDFQPDRTILPYIWFDTGGPGVWKKMRVNWKNLKTK